MIILSKAQRLCGVNPCNITLECQKDLSDDHFDSMMLQGVPGRKAELGCQWQRLQHRHLVKATGMPMRGVFPTKCQVQLGLTCRHEVSPQKHIQAQTASLWQADFRTIFLPNAHTGAYTNSSARKSEQKPTPSSNIILSPHGFCWNHLTFHGSWALSTVVTADKTSTVFVEAIS